MKYYDLARQLALEVKGKYKVAAIILDKRGRIISTGTNSYVKTHPIQAKYANKCKSEHKLRIYLHAEISALIKCRGKGHKIFILRIGTDNQDLLAKPCPICELAIKESKIKIIEYTM